MKVLLRPHLLVRKAAGAGGVRDTTFLLARGADLEHLHEYRTPLTHAAERGQAAVVTVLLDAGAGGLNASLLFSARSGHVHVAALLLDRGADVHYVVDAPLRYAALHGFLETVRLLLDRGADVHALQERALREARRNGHEAVVALLLERGAVDIPEEEEED